MSGGLSNMEHYEQCVKGDLQAALNLVKKKRNLDNMANSTINSVASEGQ